MFHIQLIFKSIETLLYGISIPINHERFQRIFDIASQEHIKAGLIFAVLLVGLIVKEHLSAPYGCIFNNKELFVSNFMCIDKLLRFLFFFVLGQFFHKTAGSFCRRMPIAI